ncbi:hypothetical protein GCM10020295_13820 [Streptomyces cinereospinus]
MDLYLIHWPVPSKDQYVDTYKAFEKLHAEGRIKAIGVSNFLPEHLRRLIGETSVVPAVNQIELHPHLQQHAAREFHAERASPPRPGRRSVRARACWRSRRSSPSRGSTAARPPRSCCAGTSSWATW